ncbi:MAG: transketolase C-terminal domain-containing protein [Candidatus Micrarchaeota archaeon]
MRTAFVKHITEMAESDKRLVVLTADMGFSLFESYRERFPDRIFNVGIAEQNMMGIAAGLALSGKVPYVYSITPFATMRPFEQIRIDICYHNLPVRIIGAGGGLTYGALGPTHHSIEDISLMRSLPNMTVMCPGDPWEAKRCLGLSHDIPGPAYIRLGKGGGDPVVHTGELEFKLGKGVVLEEGSEAAILSTGNILKVGLEARNELKKRGVDCSLISMPTVKPIDEKLVLSLAKNGVGIATLEEHSVIGGLGSAVAEILAESGMAVPFARIGLPDRFMSEVGSQEYIRKQQGLTPDGVAKRVVSLLKKR